MSIERYRDISEVPSPDRVTKVEDRLTRIAAAWHRAQIRGPVEFPRGVRRFRTLEEAQEARDRRIERRLLAIRSEGPQTSSH